jgi:hypothetical protein
MSSPQLFGTAASTRGGAMDLVSSPLFERKCLNAEESETPVGVKQQLIDSPLKPSRKRRKVRVVIPRRRSLNASSLKTEPFEVKGLVSLKEKYEEPIVLKEPDEEPVILKEPDEEPVAMEEEEEIFIADDESMHEVEPSVRTSMFGGWNWSIGWNWRQPSGSNVLAAIAVKSSEEIFEIMRSEIADE